MASPEQPIDELVSEDKSITPADVQREIDRIITGLKRENVEQLKPINTGDFVAKQRGEGTDPITVIALAFVGSLAKEAAATLWKELIWPSLKLRFGDKIKRKPE